MDKSDIAGILGLLIGGAGGYYGGKKRGEREDKKLADYFDMMKELQGGSDDGTQKVFSDEFQDSNEDIINNPVEELFSAMTDEEIGDLYEGPSQDQLYSGIGFDKHRQLYDLQAGDTNIFGNEVLMDSPMYDAGSPYYDLFKADGGRVGLANGGLGYSYKNNIFSADPSTGIPAVVDAGGDDGVADDTFINLFPGLFPPVTDPVETIIDTPAVPMGGGGGENNPFSNNYTGDPNIPFGENPMYGPSSGYDPDDPENSFLDKLGYSFYSNVALPTATMMKKNPFSIANILSSVFGDKDNDKGDPDPKGEPGPGVDGAGIDGTGGPDSQYGGGGKGEGKGFGEDKGVGQDAGTVGGTGGRRGGAGRYM